MNSQICFAMHPEDEREFEQFLLTDKSLRFIAGPRWKSKTPKTFRSLAKIDDMYCIIWSKDDLAKLDAEYIPSCDDWYCRTEYATIQFLRSELKRTVLTTGRIAVSTLHNEDFSPDQEKSLEQRYKSLRSFLKKNYSNSIVQWRDPTVSYAPASPNRSANPSPPDAQLWVGPHALHWLREKPNRKLKQFCSTTVEAVLVRGAR